MTINIVQPPGSPAPAGHYSPAIEHGGTVYVSGQLGRGPGLTDAQAGDIRVQTRRALASIEAILQAAGTDLANVLKMNVYISDIDLWPACNEQYAQILGSHRPARAIIPTGALHYGALVEIDAIAALRHP